MTELTTYRELKRYLESLTDAQLDQPVQVAEPSPSEKTTLLPIIAAGTVAEMEFERCRSSVDNRYHADEVVLLSDFNGWGEDGANGYQMNEDHSLTPLYPPEGPTPKEAQYAPGVLEALKNIRRRYDEHGEADVLEELREMHDTGHHRATLNRRLAKFNAQQV